MQLSYTFTFRIINKRIASSPHFYYMLLNTQRLFSCFGIYKYQYHFSSILSYAFLRNEMRRIYIVVCRSATSLYWGVAPAFRGHLSIPQLPPIGGIRQKKYQQAIIKISPSLLPLLIYSIIRCY